MRRSRIYLSADVRYDEMSTGNEAAPVGNNVLDLENLNKT